LKFLEENVALIFFRQSPISETCLNLQLNNRGVYKGAQLQRVGKKTN